MNRSIFFLPVIVAALALPGCAATAPHPVAIERLTPEQLVALKPLPNLALPLEDVVALSKAGAAPEEIIQRLRETHTIHLLSAQQIVDLYKQGVDQAVIDYMADAQEKARQSRMLTELADRDADQARQLEQERRQRRAAELNYGFGGFFYGHPGYGMGWSPGHLAPFPYG